MLTEDVRAVLLTAARQRQLITYRAVAGQLQLTPPQTIHRVTLALEALMAADAAAGRPLLAALCVSQRLRDRPARGFFLTAARLGVFAGAPDGPEARAFHAAEVARVLAAYGSEPAGG